MTKKIMVFILLGLFALCLLIPSVISGDGDIYYFTDTDISFNTDQYGLFIALTLFFFFFYIGYKSEKRSGGGFMLLSGIMLLALEALLINYLNPILVIPLISPFALFIIVLGIRKWLYPFKGEKTKSEGN